MKPRTKGGPGRAFRARASIVAVCAQIALLALLPGGPLAAQPGLEAPGAGDYELRRGALVLEGPRSALPTLERLAEQIEPLLTKLKDDLGGDFRAPFRIVLLPPRSRQSERVARLDALAPNWASGFLLAPARVGAIRLSRVDRYPYDDALEVLVHEVAHMLLYDLGGEALPRWFEEGAASWLDQKWGLRDAWTLSSGAVAQGLPALEDLDELFQSNGAAARLAYAASFDFLRFALDREGDELLPRLLEATGNEGFEAAWLTVTGRPLDAHERSWRRRHLFWYRWLPVLTGGGVLWGGITLLAVVAGLTKKRRRRQLEERWAREEELGHLVREARALDEGDETRPSPKRQEWIH